MTDIADNTGNAGSIMEVLKKDIDECAAEIKNLILQVSSPSALNDRICSRAVEHPQMELKRLNVPEANVKENYTDYLDPDEITFRRENQLTVERPLMYSADEDVLSFMTPGRISLDSKFYVKEALVFKKRDVDDELPEEEAQQIRHLHAAYVDAIKRRNDPVADNEHSSIAAICIGAEIGKSKHKLANKFSSRVQSIVHKAIGNDSDAIWEHFLNEQNAELEQCRATATKADVRANYESFLDPKEIEWRQEYGIPTTAPMKWYMSTWAELQWMSPGHIVLDYLYGDYDDDDSGYAVFDNFSHAEYDAILEANDDAPFPTKSNNVAATTCSNEPTSTTTPSTGGSKVRKFFTVLFFIYAIAQIAYHLL